MYLSPRASTILNTFKDKSSYKSKVYLLIITYYDKCLFQKSCPFWNISWQSNNIVKYGRLTNDSHCRQKFYKLILRYVERQYVLRAINGLMRTERGKREGSDPFPPNIAFRKVSWVTELSVGAEMAWRGRTKSLRIDISLEKWRLKKWGEGCFFRGGLVRNHELCLHTCQC